MSSLEYDLEKEIVNYLRSQKHLAYSNDATLNQFNRPDITACIHGIYVELEVKLNKKKYGATQGQLNVLNYVEGTKFGKGRVVESLDEVKELIKEIETEHGI